jgi:hypothetical protein
MPPIGMAGGKRPIEQIKSTAFKADRDLGSGRFLLARVHFRTSAFPAFIIPFFEITICF